VIDFEGSVKMVPNAKCDYVSIKKGKDLEDLVATLVGQFGNPYRHISIDTAEKMVPMCIKHVTDVWNETHKDPLTKGLDIREAGQKGAGWTKLNEYVANIPNRLEQAGYGVTVLGHLTEEKRENPITRQESVVLRGDLSPKILAAMLRDAQFVCALEMGRANVLTGHRMAGKTKVPQYEMVRRHTLRLSMLDTDNDKTQLVKGRLLDHLPAALDITGSEGWDKWVEAYEAARKAVTA
jgi:hypothetical protein